MRFINKDYALKSLSETDWQLYSGLEESSRAAWEISQAVRAALKKLPQAVADGATIQTAAIQAYKSVLEVMKLFSDVGATDTEPRGVLMAILEEFVLQRFGVEIDLYWEV